MSKFIYRKEAFPGFRSFWLAFGACFSEIFAKNTESVVFPTEAKAIIADGRNLSRQRRSASPGEGGSRLDLDS